MVNKCLYCYEPVENGLSYHKNCSMEFFGTPVAPNIEYSLSQMDELAKNVVERSVSVPGVQAKLSLSLVRKTKETADKRLTIVGALGGQYIFKPPSEHYCEMPQNEHLSMRIARSFGIRVVPSSLIRLASGELSYITKRIDRSDSCEKIHMIDMFQITEANDKYKSSMEKIGKAIGEYSVNTLLDKVFYFELVLFSFLTGNNDMHLKNFSLIKSSSGWMLSPAYDLLNVAIVLPDDKEELALPMRGRKKRFTRNDFEQFGTDLGLTDKQIQSIFRRMIKKKAHAFSLIDISFHSDEMKMAYKSVMETKYHQLEMM
ncbi:MAG TPA: HipA domain-containing protein [Bacteroidales bacterium]|nr:HipA domain-containing protein [Bacteroidales bacterium]